MAESIYALILAGGSGTRFWPLSRNSQPKQLLKLFDETTLLEETVDRLEGLVPRENILILTNVQQEAAVREIVSSLPPENIIAEPAKRDTAPAIALGIGWVAARDADATMIVLPSDQLIQDREEFQRILAAAAVVADEGEAVVTVGIKPTWACPGYGYIERGARVSLAGVEETVGVFEVARFREKPDPELAERFVANEDFAWNAGIFIWSIATVTRELSRHCPELADFVAEVRDSPDRDATIANRFPSLPQISIDYALMEKASRVLNVEATFDWDDVGSWISVAKYLPRDESANAANCEFTHSDCSGNIIFSNDSRHIALLGVHDLIVVQTKDAILVANRNQADHIKNLVKEIPEGLL